LPWSWIGKNETLCGRTAPDWEQEHASQVDAGSPKTRSAAQRMQSWTVKAMPHNKTNRHLAAGTWPLKHNEPAVAGASVSDSVAAYAGVSLSAASVASIGDLSDVVAHLLPHLRAVSGLLNMDGEPEDTCISEFIESLIATGAAGTRMTPAELETRFFRFLDARQGNNLYAIYLSSGAETNAIGRMTLHELSKILEVNPEICSSDTGL
tara:strand:+ start:78 stop:701 length:624 start_codon:yes stop_codon:yes gene_type:complete